MITHDHGVLSMTVNNTNCGGRLLQGVNRAGRFKNNFAAGILFQAADPVPFNDMSVADPVTQLISPFIIPFDGLIICDIMLLGKVSEEILVRRIKVFIKTEMIIRRKDALIYKIGLRRNALY